MRKILICLLVVSLSVSIFAVSGNAQKNIKKVEIITNATIVKMVKAKLGDTIILSKIKSGKTDFDLSTDAIVKLKESRVSDKVIEAMMGAESDSSPQTPAVTVATPPKVESVSPPQTQEAAVATPLRVKNVLTPQTQKAAPQIKTDKDSYNYGETIKVSFFNAPGDQKDWICIVPVGSPDTEGGDYKHMPQGLNQGILTFDSPSSGKYEVRAYYNYSSNGYVVSARYGFSVLNGSLQATTSESQKTTTQPQEKEHRTTENVWSAAWQGAGIANKISENTYSVVALASIWSENTANMYKQWDAAAKKACDGRAYKVTERQYIQGSGRENRQSKIIGTIECTK